MTKPFDTAELATKVKSMGLPILEKDLKLLTEAIFDWSKESVVLAGATQPLYLFAVPVLEQVKAVAIAAEDHIDGVIGN